MTLNELELLCNHEWDSFCRLTPSGSRYNGRNTSTMGDLKLLLEDMNKEVPEAIQLVTELLKARMKR